LSGSVTGVNYTLLLNGVSTGNTVAGNGSAITFGNQSTVGTYTAQAANASNCIAPMQGSVPVSMMPLPGTPGAPTGPGYVNTSTTATTQYTTTGGQNTATYAWVVEPAEAGTTSGNGITGTVDWSETYLGTANVLVKGINQCGESALSDAFAVTVDNNVGIGEPGTEQFSIYPNPTDGKVKIAFTSRITGNVQIIITTTLGQEVLCKSYNLSGNVLNLDLSDLGSGVFLIRIDNFNTSVYKRLVISQ
jgi:hypothetical protein